MGTAFRIRMLSGHYVDPDPRRRPSADPSRPRPRGGEELAALVHPDLGRYLDGLLLRFANGVHAAARVYTCRSWRATEGATRPHDMHWNRDAVPGETSLGSFGWSVPAPLVAAAEAELARGDAIRVFLFNSDADLCFEEVLIPV